MTRNARIAYIVGAALMAAGTIGPWVQVSIGVAGAVPVSGFGHGAGILLVLLGLAVVLLRRAEGAAQLVGLLAVLWMAYCAYALPGDFTDAGAWQAEGAWGMYVSLVGALVLGLGLVAAAFARLQTMALRLAAARVARQA
ncbi:MAG TPA: hypothetical protein VGM33_15010 [Baekduia sp.]|jgi:hypothetical protein